jgi:hypothetical protein
MMDPTIAQLVNILRGLADMQAAYGAALSTVVDALMAVDDELDADLRTDVGTLRLALARDTEQLSGSVEALGKITEGLPP